jgi:diadenosine tetraphosphatase ApaH/serine/threonine PP2A family protein phosphatase
LRTAILTDIHANLPALEAVIARANELGVERWVCLGDTVGYAAEPNECCALVRERVSFSLLGNHDAAVAGRMSYDYYYAAARDALEWTTGQMTADNLAWLKSLPYTVREGAIEYSHGSPLQPDQYEYIFVLDQAAELLPVLGDLADVTFIGHSHLPRAFSLSDDGADDVYEEVVEIRAGAKYIISIGSVGQPRDHDPRACFGIWDDVARTVEFHRVAYPIEPAAAKILEAGLSEHFARRLFVGT